MIRAGTEWGVVSFGFRGVVSVHRGGMDGPEEAEAWKRALELTRKRTNRESFAARSSVTMHEPLEVASREVSEWQPWKGSDA